MSVPLELPGRDRPARMLLIDESPFSRELIASQLEEWGYEVATSDSGHTGLTMFEQYQQDLVIYDLNMPHFTGQELLCRLRALAPDVLIIILCDPLHPEVINQIMQWGVHEVVIKEPQLDSLHRSLERSLAYLRLLVENRTLLSEVHRLNRVREDWGSEKMAELEEKNGLLQSEIDRLQQLLSRQHPPFRNSRS
jgi:CheY-like chemotaxis protein